MSIKVHIPSPLRQYVGQADALDVEARTVGEALTHISSTYPEIKRHLYNDAGKLRSFINIYVNDEDVRYLKQDETPLSESDEIRIIPSIAGGKATVAAPAPSTTEALRYSRHLILPEVGMEGQLQLPAVT